MEVPMLTELSMNNAWEIAQSDSLIISYLPQRDWNSRGVNRDYLWAKICTVRPKYATYIINEALNKRENVVHWNEARDGLGVCDEVGELLLSRPYRSKKYVFLSRKLFNCCVLTLQVQY